jgi:hypothetical protein
MDAFKIKTMRPIILLSLILVLVGCASVETGHEWRKFQEIAKERTDQELGKRAEGHSERG